MTNMSSDRKRQVETTRARYGPEHYKSIGSKGATFKDKEVARLAIRKRWHPGDFDENGKLKENLDADNN